MKDKVIFFKSELKGDNKKFILFSNPVKEIVCLQKNKINSSLHLLDRYINAGYYVAGFICYETGGYFNDINLKIEKLPFFYFGIFSQKKLVNLNYFQNNKDKFVLYDLQDNISFDEYKSNIKKIKDLLKNGETYQINYCFKKKFRFAGDAFALFLELLENQNTDYSAFIKYNNINFLSLSPELFFSIKKNKIKMKPMKGTVIKGSGENLKKIKDEKNLAENIMIVDLIRNDLGKICEINSIKVPEKFTVEKYKTVYQMTSTITGKLKKNIKFSEIIAALFPSGSVTGAPKRRSMQIINSLEKEQRGIYTGTIGYFHKNRAVFNICIRTPVIDSDSGRGEIGIGSGIVYDSNSKKEYKECQGKANFFVSLAEDFSVFESILYNKADGFFLLQYHIKRLKNACKWFGFKFDEIKIRKALNMCAYNIKGHGDYKVRIFINSTGDIKTDFSKIEKDNKIIKLCIADELVNSDNEFLYYKTTKRDFYERNLKKARQNGYDDIVFMNEKGQITECSTSNIFIRKNGIFYTPPVCCGLLNGIYRQYLLRTHPFEYKEKLIYKKDLLNAQEIYICNSVRKVSKAFLK